MFLETREIVLSSSTITFSTLRPAAAAAACVGDGAAVAAFKTKSHFNLYTFFEREELNLN